jgi:DNA-binding transcriptional ArsR family regulator
VPPASGDVDIAAVASLLAEPARADIVLRLGDGRAQPAGQLARAAGVAPSTASGHLARLVAGGILAVEQHGRHRYYRLSGARVGRLIEALAPFAPRRPVRGLASATRSRSLEEARTCYDHLAGRLGVRVLDALLRLRVLEGHDGSFVKGADRLAAPGRAVEYRLGPRAGEVLGDLGLTLESIGGRRPLLRYCVDWTEQRHHLSGALGAALLDRLLELRWVERAPQHRALAVTAAGARGLARALELTEGAPTAGGG